MQWHPGRNNRLVYRGRGGEVCDQVRLLVANLLWNVRHNGAGVFANAMPAPGGKQGEKAMRCSVVAQLLGIPHQTVRGIENRLDTNGWVVIRNRRARTWQDGEQKSGKRARTRQESTTKSASDSSDDSYLPKLSPRHHDEAHPSDEDMDFMDTDFEVSRLASGSHLRRRSQLEQWREHPNYMPGMTR